MSGFHGSLNLSFYISFLGRGMERSFTTTPRRPWSPNVFPQSVEMKALWRQTRRELGGGGGKGRAGGRGKDKTDRRRRKALLAAWKRKFSPLSAASIAFGSPEEETRLQQRDKNGAAGEPAALVESFPSTKENTCPNPHSVLFLLSLPQECFKACLN